MAGVAYKTSGSTNKEERRPRSYGDPAEHLKALATGGSARSASPETSSPKLRDDSPGEQIELLGVVGNRPEHEVLEARPDERRRGVHPVGPAM